MYAINWWKDDEEATKNEVASVDQRDTDVERGKLCNKAKCPNNQLLVLLHFLLYCGFFQLCIQRRFYGCNEVIHTYGLI